MKTFPSFVLVFSVLYATLLLIAFSGKPSESYQQRDTSVECFATYLKQQNINDEIFNTVRPLYSMTELCLRGVEFEKDQLFSQAKLNFRYGHNFKCLEENLNDDTYKNMLLKLRTVKSISEGVVKKLENMWSGTKTPKQRAVERVGKELNEYFASKDLYCNLKVGFEELFDSYFEIEYEEENFVPYEDVEDFCIKKELVDQEVIDPMKYNIKMYPKNIKTENLDCSNILEPLKTNMIASLKEFQSGIFRTTKNRCAFSVLKDGNDYFNFMLKMELLSKLVLNDEQKKEEKKNFSDKMVEISLKINKECIKGQISF